MHSRFSYLALFSAAALAFSGCEWGGAHEDTWNDGYSWANFTGTYRFVKALVYLPSSSDDDNNNEQPSNSTTPEDQYNTVDAVSSTTMKTDTTADGKVTAGDSGIVKGSFSVTVNGKTVKDKDNGDGTGTLRSSAGSVGSITYATGEWLIDNGYYFEAVAGMKVTINYSYRNKKVVPPEVPPGEYPPGTYPGYSQVNLSFLKVTQQGNKLTMSGSNGIVYKGRITGANVGKDDWQAARAVYISFEVSNAQGMTITGNFSGNWSGASDKSYGVLSNRQIHGTHSRAGNFVGTAADTTIAVPTLQVNEFPLTTAE